LRPMLIEQIESERFAPVPDKIPRTRQRRHKDSRVISAYSYEVPSIVQLFVGFWCLLVL
jgi:hypothetical protein